MALFDNIVTVARPYLGPATEQFLTRQITAHLGTTKENLQLRDLDPLAQWCYMSGKLIMDEARAKELSSKVRTVRN